MNKNTIIAIVLSTIVVIGAFVFQGFFGSSKSNTTQAATVTEKTENNAEVTEESAESKSVSEKKPVTFVNSSVTEVVKTTVSTSTADIVFTNKGGDIVSYRLKNHLDQKNKDAEGNPYGVEMADNIVDEVAEGSSQALNRAFSLTLGTKDPVNSEIINVLFSEKNPGNWDIPAEGDDPDFKTKTFQAKINTENGNVILEKKYTFFDKKLSEDEKPSDEYMFKLDISFIGEEGKNLSLDGYVLRNSPQIGPFYDTGNRYDKREFVTFYDGKDKSKSISGGDRKMYEDDSENSSKAGYVWNGIAGKYFVSLFYPAPETQAGLNHTWYDAKEWQKGDLKCVNSQAFVVRNPIEAENGKSTDTYYIYLGPKNEKELKIYNVADENPWKLEGLKFNNMISGGWLGWLETILKWILELIHMVVPNWGVCIIIMTILLKLALFPISRKQMMSSIKMQEIQPKLKEIQENYKNNPQKQQEMIAKVYKESGYNPMSGCLPMIFQFLILFAMFYLFNDYFEFRGSVFIPGWIDDLSTGDSVVTFGFGIPFLGDTLRILPIIYLASQLFYGKITNNGGMAGTSNKQMMFMMYGMPILFFFLFYNAPSGLLLYWTVSNIFQMGQQIIINKLKAKHMNGPSSNNRVASAGKFKKHRK